MCSETSEAVGTTWEHAQLEFQNFLKIRITLAHNEHIVGSKNEHGANIRAKLIVPIRLQQKIK